MSGQSGLWTPWGLEALTSRTALLGRTVPGPASSVAARLVLGPQGLRGAAGGGQALLVKQLQQAVSSWGGRGWLVVRTRGGVSARHARCRKRGGEDEDVVMEFWISG